MRRRAAFLVACALAAATAAGQEPPSELDSDRRPRLRTGGTCVVRGATIHTAVSPPFVGDVLVRDGKIAAVGRVTAPAGTIEIDGAGGHLAPGVVDTHSHIAVDGSVNEGTVSISAEVSIEDVIDAEDVSIYRALAGGVTTIRILHGSANTIGGRHAVIKLKWGHPASELRFAGAPTGIKFALGENPKRSNASSRTERFPSSRMGVEAVLYRAFSRADEYARVWAEHEQRVARGEDPDPPRRDVRLEVLAGILRHDVLVHSHCYRADEILMLLRASERFGFTIATLQHVLEGYKVAREIADLRVGASTFSDWWAYKIEAYDAIPHNAALLDEAGVLTTINSDSAEMMRRLYAEAGKSVRYAGLDPVRALALVTIHGARQIGVDDRVGSIETGKDADLVLLTGDPLSSLARVRWTMVDGEIEFERRDAFGLDANPPPVPALTEFVPETRPALEGEVLAITGATLHPITSPDVEGGTLLIQGGRILAMGRGVPIPAGSKTIQADGKHVWPGMIALDSSIGLLEIDSIASTDDRSDIGGNQPDLRVAASINADSAHIGVTRSNGVTRTQTSPQGGGPMMGQSAVVRLRGDTWEEMLAVDRDMLHVRFPETANDAKEKKEGDEVRELRRLLDAARDHGRIAELASNGNGVARPSFDPRLEALVPYARGEKKVAIHADNAQTILFALKFAKEEGLSAVLYGAREGWKVADAIARAGVPVVVGPVIALPTTRFDPYDAAFANPAILARAGVPFAIASKEGENERNLPFHAAIAAAYGLPREEALRAITYYPARILGVDRELGSLAPGKIADVVVTDGDLLEVRTRVEHLFVEGEPVDLGNRQTQLYERYRERLNRLRAAKGAPAPR